MEFFYNIFLLVSSSGRPMTQSGLETLSLSQSYPGGRWYGWDRMVTRAFVLLGGGRPEERGRRHQERLMAGVGGKVASLGAGSRPSPEMLPHPWHQPPP